MFRAPMVIYPVALAVIKPIINIPINWFYGRSLRSLAIGEHFVSAIEPSYLKEPLLNESLCVHHSLSKEL